MVTQRVEADVYFSANVEKQWRIRKLFLQLVHLARASCRSGATLRTFY